MRQLAATVVLAICLIASVFAQLTVAPFSASPPDEIVPPLRSLLGAEGAKVIIGSTTLEFWWVTTLQANAGTTAWSQVAEGALIGAVRVTGVFKEIRGKTIKPGVYTLRYGLQPQNGDHLGASPFREYLLVSPAEADTNPAPLGFDGTVAISKQTTGGSHPAALSLDPPVASAAPLSLTTNDLDHKGVVFQVKTSSGALKFGVILIGLIEH